MLCAESQSDSPTEKCAVIAAIDAVVRNGSVSADPETLQLYEWACSSSQASINYSDTNGALRLRWVKANPRNPAAVSCLQACVQHWDLTNAQQVGSHPPRPPLGSPYLTLGLTTTRLLLFSTNPQPRGTGGTCTGTSPSCTSFR